jgi:ribose-phosphate pyrophosphokinase
MDTMCADKAISWRPDVIYAFAEDEGQAGALALRCGAPLAELNVHTFPDGETLVTAEPTVQSIQGSALIYKSLHHPNGKLVDLLFAADAVRSLCARSVILAAPYMPYMRQDRAFQLGQAVSQKVFGQALGQAFDGLVTVQPHLHRTSQLSAVTGRPALSLNAGRAIAAHMAAQTDADTIIVGPDEES